MKKILYVMNVEWNWIKQRPHFIAEQLNESVELIVYYQYRYGRKGLQKRNQEGLKLRPVFLIPKISGNEKLRFLNDWLLGLVVRSAIRREKPDYVYLTYPTQQYCVPSKKSCKVIYDCMDDHMEFYASELTRKKIKCLEEKLCKTSDYIFGTSNNLINKIKKRYACLKEKEIALIRNAFDGKVIDVEKEINSNSRFKLAYVGTISNWFDFSVLVNSLEEFSNIEYYLYGPLDNVEVPKHECLHYMGTIEHAKLYDEVKDKNALLMPFVVNEIIEAVDPVKLYEYINFNKNVICVRYDEIERFEKYVSFYNGYDEYRSVLKSLIENPKVKYELEARKLFLKENTWKERVNTIKKIIGI